MTRKTGITRLLRKYKLEHHRKAIESGLLPAVRIWCWYRPRAAVPPGGSKLGGEPDLHWSEPWPSQDGRPLHFLGQLRLSEVARHLPKGSLPAKGRISLWYNSLGELEREARPVITPKSEPSLVHLRYEPDESRPVQRRPWPVHHEISRWREPEDWAPYPESPVRFEPIRTLGQAAISRIMDAEEAIDGRDGWNRCYEFLRELERAGNRYDGQHRVLGDVYRVQGDPRYTAACAAAGLYEFDRRPAAREKRLKAEAARYRLLFLLDTDPQGPGFSWGDCGSLQWWIRDDDLKAGRLERAVGIHEQGG